MTEEQQSSPPSYMTLADFLKDAEDCQVVPEIFEELEAESSQRLLDESLRRQQDWSILAHQVVGAEQAS
jgi:hypothetical protein